MVSSYRLWPTFLCLQIFKSRGDLGLFRNHKRQITLPAEFHFKTGERAQVRCQALPLEEFSKVNFQYAVQREFQFYLSFQYISFQNSSISFILQRKSFWRCSKCANLHVSSDQLSLNRPPNTAGAVQHKEPKPFHLATDVSCISSRPRSSVSLLISRRGICTHYL